MHQSDQEQIQLFKEWWHKYGNAILLALAVYFLTSCAWHFWHKHKMQQNEQASVLYSQMFDMNDEHKDKEATLYAERLVKDYPVTTYASLAALMLAKHDVLAGNLESAVKHLQWVVDHTKRTSLRQIAKIREARILAAQQKFQMALALLEPVEDKSFTAAVAEATGDIYMAQHDEANAQKSYKLAVDTTFGEAKSPLLMDKLKQFERVN